MKIENPKEFLKSMERSWGSACAQFSKAMREAKASQATKKPKEAEGK